MKKTKLFLFTLMAFFVVGFAVNVDAREVTEDLTLTEDVNEEIVIPAGKTVTLNLGGKTITAPSGKVAITNNGTLTIEGDGNVVANGNYAVLNHGAKLTINGGSYSKTDSGAKQSLISNGWYTNSDNVSGAFSEMIIDDGSFDGGSFTAIKNDAYGKMTINGGTFVSSMSDAGIQEAGSSITINGGTFDAVVYLMNWASFDGEEKTTVINGGTFNKLVNIASDNNLEAAKASKVSVSIGENPVFNANLYVSNSSAAEGTNPIVVEKFDVKVVKGALTFGTRYPEYKMPAVTLDGMTIGGSLTLNNVESSIIKNTTVNGTEIKAGDVTLENVTAKAYTPAGKNGTVTFGEGTKITKVNTTLNSGNVIIVDGGEIGSISSTGKKNTYGYDSITVNSGSVGSIETSKGNINVNGGKVDSITILNKYVTTNPVTVSVSEGAIVGIIDNQRLEVSEPNTTINLPENYAIQEDNTVLISISDVNVSGIDESYSYTGSDIIPNVVVKNGDVVLKEDTDYKVTLTDNLNIGIASIKIEGQNNYTGTIEKTFEITAADLSSALVEGIKTKTYNNGYAQRQNDLVVTLYDKALVKDVDYRVTYKNYVNAGTATMTITGIGNYTGKITKEYKIKKAKNPLAIKAYNKTVSYSKVKKSAQVVKPIYVSKKVGTLTYTKMSGSSTKLLLNKTTGKVTVKKGTKKGKYKIKIKVFASGSSNYFSNYGIKTIYVTVK